MKKLLLFTLLIASIAVVAQPNLSWKMDDPELINGGTQFRFKVYVMSDAPGYYFGLQTVAFSYGNAAFGSWIVPDHVTVDRGLLLQEEIAAGLPKYNVQGVANTFEHTMSSSIQQNFSGPANPIFHTEIPTTWGEFFIYTIDIVPGAAPGTITEIIFYDNTAPPIPLMNQQCFYIDPVTGDNLPVGNTNNMPQLDPSDIYNFEVVPGGAASTSWTGAVNDVWNDLANWDNGVPDASTDVVIPAGMPNDPGIYGLAEAQNMQVDFGVMVSIYSGGGALTVHGDLTNDGIVSLEGSTGGPNASFINMGALNGTGSFEFFQDVAGLIAPPADPTGWHYMASPFDGFDSDQMWDYYLNTWDETTSMWVQHTGNPSIPCDPAPNMALGTMEAWSVKFDTDWPGVNNCPGGTGTTVEFYANTMGDVHSGPYSAPATFTAGGSYEGWNFFGNPYPSAVDPAGIVWDASADQSVYVWDGFANTYVSWAGGVGPMIPPTQGFFVHFNAAGTLDLTDAARTHTNDWFWKSEINDLVNIEVTAEESDYHDNLYVRFLDDATPSFDKVWDAYKLKSYVPGVPQIYTTGSGYEYSINALPATDAVAMSFECIGEGTFTISAVDVNDIGTVILEDLFTGETTDLLTSSYTFVHNNGNPAERFVLHFSPLGIDDNLAGKVDIYANENTIIVNTNLTDRGDIVVYNLMGQEVVRTEMQPGMNTIPVSEVNTNYVVKVMTNHKVVTGKVFVK